MLAVCGVILPSKPPGCEKKKKHHKFEGICNAFSSVCKTHLFVFFEKKNITKFCFFSSRKDSFWQRGTRNLSDTQLIPPTFPNTPSTDFFQEPQQKEVYYTYTICTYFYFFYQRSITSISTSIQVTQDPIPRERMTDTSPKQLRSLLPRRLDKTRTRWKTIRLPFDLFGLFSGSMFGCYFQGMYRDQTWNFSTRMHFLIDVWQHEFFLRSAKAKHFQGHEDNDHNTVFNDPVGLGGRNFSPFDGLFQTVGFLGAQLSDCDDWRIQRWTRPMDFCLRIFTKVSTLTPWTGTLR